MDGKENRMQKLNDGGEEQIISRKINWIRP
jgi:hypothetical protein